MGCRTTPRHLVRTCVLLLLGLDSFSWALQPVRPPQAGEQLAEMVGDYVQPSAQHHHRKHQPQQHPHQQHQQHQHQQHHHQRHTPQQQSHQRNPSSSLGSSLISGPGSNGAPDYRQPASPGVYRVHHRVGVPAGHQDTPPQHRRHHVRSQYPLQQQPQPHAHRQPNGSRRGGDANTGSGSTVRPVTRMLTRGGTSSFDGTRYSNNTSKNICTVYMYRKAVRTSHSMQPCLDGVNCGQRTYSYPVAKRETCCRGWETTTTIADGCFKPICQTPCRNGGKCTAPDRCSCPAGFTGKACELDVNECKEYKPCDQTCYNTEGSYYCTCRDGFMLQSDRQSCRRIDETNDIATEARDMENDVDYDSLDIRLKKLEQMLSREERRSNSEKQELQKKVQYTIDAVSVLKSQVARLSQKLFPSDYGNWVH